MLSNDKTNIKINIVSRENIDYVVEYMHKLNNISKHHIGYCGKVKSEIKSSVEELINEGNEFYVASLDNEILGVMGYEYYNNTAEIWGPFVLEYNVKILKNLWDRINQKINNNSKYISNINEKNYNAIRFYKENDFKFAGRGQTMILDLKNYNSVDNNEIKMLSEDNFKSFIKLHDKTFPSTYYNGNDIVNILNDNNVVFIIKKHNILIGYIFITIDKDYNEGDIEFIGIDEMYRHKGYGRDLMNMALNYFKRHRILELQLWVNSDNKRAINLYNSVGFKLDDILVNYKN